MNIKHILAIIVFIIVIVGGPAYVLFVKGDSKPQQNTTAQKSEPKTEPQTKATEPSFNKAKYSYDDPASIWIVANKQRPLNPQKYEPSDLVHIGSGKQLRKEAADNLTKLIQAAKTESLSIEPISAYRSYSTQVTVYRLEVNAYGSAVADTQSARPGTSEHQTGLAVDVGGGGCGIDDCFANTAEGKWLAANAHTYGFIIRYPEGKQAITGYRYEPWHIRYVGTELSIEMHKKGVQTLEEFFGLPAAPNY